MARIRFPYLDHLWNNKWKTSLAETRPNGDHQNYVAERWFFSNCVCCVLTAMSHSICPITVFIIVWCMPSYNGGKLGYMPVPVMALLSNWKRVIKFKICLSKDTFVCPNCTVCKKCMHLTECNSQNCC